MHRDPRRTYNKRFLTYPRLPQGSHLPLFLTLFSPFLKSVLPLQVLLFGTHFLSTCSSMLLYTFTEKRLVYFISQSFTALI